MFLRPSFSFSRPCSWSAQFLYSLNPALSFSSTSTTSSSPKLSATMKTLVDSGSYREALQLFYKSPHVQNDPSVTLALKCAMKLQDYQSGMKIHRQLSSKSLKNPWVQSTLIHFYSKWAHARDDNTSRYFLVQCRDITGAEKVFSSVQSNNLHAYGALLKGKATVTSFNLIT